MQECRERALPEKNDFVGLVGADAQDSIEVYTFDDGTRREGDTYVRVAAPHPKNSAAPSTGSTGSVSKAGPSRTPTDSMNKAPSIKFGPPKAKITQQNISEPSKPKESLHEKDPANNGGIANGGCTSRGPTPPPISRASTPTPQPRGQEQRSTYADPPPVSADQRHTSLPPHSASAGPGDVIPAQRAALASANLNNVPPSAAAGPRSVAIAPRAVSAGPESVYTPLRTALVAARVASVGPESTIIAPRAPSTNLRRVGTALRAASAGPKSTIISPHVASADLGGDAIKSCTAPTSPKPIPLRAASAGSGGVGIESRPTPASPRGSSAGLQSAVIPPRAASANPGDVAIALRGTSLSSEPGLGAVGAIVNGTLESGDLPAPSSATIIATSSTVSSVPKRVSARLAQMAPPTMSSTQLPSGSVAVPSMQHLEDIESAKAACKRKDGPTTVASDQKKRKTSGQGISSTSNSSNHMDVDGTANPPDWITNALALLRSSQLGPEWDSLVNKWLTFEANSGYYEGPRKLGARNRPQGSLIGFNAPANQRITWKSRTSPCLLRVSLFGGVACSRNGELTILETQMREMIGSTFTAPVSTAY